MMLHRAMPMKIIIGASTACCFLGRGGVATTKIYIFLIFNGVNAYRQQNGNQKSPMQMQLSAEQNIFER